MIVENPIPGKLYELRSHWTTAISISLFDSSLSYNDIDRDDVQLGLRTVAVVPVGSIVFYIGKTQQNLHYLGYGDAFGVIFEPCEFHQIEEKEETNYEADNRESDPWQTVPY